MLTQTVLRQLVADAESSVTRVSRRATTALNRSETAKGIASGSPSKSLSVPFPLATSMAIRSITSKLKMLPFSAHSLRQRQLKHRHHPKHRSLPSLRNPHRWIIPQGRGLFISAGRVMDCRRLLVSPPTTMRRNYSLLRSWALTRTSSPNISRPPHRGNHCPFMKCRPAGPRRQSCMVLDPAQQWQWMYLPILPLNKHLSLVPGGDSLAHRVLAA